MNIQLFKVSGDKYTFAVNGKNSAYLSKRIAVIKPYYDYPWEAYRCATKLTTDWNHHLIAIAQSDLIEDEKIVEPMEDTLADHYSLVYHNLLEEIEASLGNNKHKDDALKRLDMIIKELESVVDQLNQNLQKEPDAIQDHPKEYSDIGKLLSKFKMLRKTYFPEYKIQETSAKEKVLRMVRARSFKADDSLKKEVMQDYADLICKFLQDLHDDIFAKINFDTGEISICRISDCKSVLFKIQVNDQLLVENIIPQEDVYRSHPLHSVEFYQKYWKPIVEAIGHFYLSDIDVLLVCGKIILPDIPRDYPLETNIKGWGVKEKRPKEVSLSFKKGDDSSLWLFDFPKTKKTASVKIKEVSNYTEEDYLNGVFKCIDLKLESIYGQTGSVIQVIPHPDFIEVDINFGRGIGVVRLTEDKIEKVI